MATIRKELSTQEKLKILADAAKYDVSCTSSGSDRRGRKGYLGNANVSGICHSFAADGRCISLLKILMSNHCIYDCKYCLNRASNDVERATFTPEEICSLTMEFYKRNYIEGLFLSSGVVNNPAYTMEKMCNVLELLRNTYKFNGYIHIKAIPGAPDELLAKAGYLADRLSVNIELPTKESLRKLAPNKSFETIVKPMKKITEGIASNRLGNGKDRYLERSTVNAYLPNSIFNEKNLLKVNENADNSADKNANKGMNNGANKSINIVTNNGEIGTNLLNQVSLREKNEIGRSFAPAGQSTQMIVGASPESDYNLIMTTQKLYQYYDLKRVFFSAYIPINEDKDLPDKDFKPPLLREHRLYQADWLLRYYGFQAGELLSEERPNFNEYIDPKCDWAVRHLGEFPVDIQTASYEKILRVPGIGPKSARRIMQTRRYGKLRFEDLKKMGVVLKRAHYFITCSGKMMYKIPVEENYITRRLIENNNRENWQISNREEYRQLSLFD